MIRAHDAIYGTRVAVIVVIALVGCAIASLLESHVGFSLSDEGYLWYGVQRTALGEVPLRDFLSYDPARYYWAAAFVRIFGNIGIVAVRAATVAFFAVGIVVAVCLVWECVATRVPLRWFVSLLIVLLCLLWGVPWWKQYDEAMSIILVASLSYVLAQPNTRRFFMHGVVVGVAAMIGRNHGVYGVLASIIAFPFLAVASNRPAWHRCIPAWVAGVLTGFSPILLALLCDRHFALMFWDSIHYMLFEYKGTNLPLPIPWPWTLPAASIWTFMGVRSWFIGCLYVVMPVLCAGGLVLLIRELRRNGLLTYPVFAACVFTAIPYLNVAYSRADALHLAQSIFPFLLALLCFPWQERRADQLRLVSVGVVALVSVWVTLPLHPAYMARTAPDWRTVTVDGDRLLMDNGVANSVEDIQHFAAVYGAKNRTVLSVPVWPGAYALLDIKSPVYEIYSLFPRSDAFQRQEIERLSHVAPSLVFFEDIGVDGRDNLRYEHTHLLMTQYIEDHYRQIPSLSTDPLLKVYVRR
ncbi:hypothetical protein EKH79_09550 [Dyella dinghuensis]|uniref:Glycosyltransferase RgtA/B/C/D-like domain-containing protein n=1 Tax=Dyella dinghuensis TaxID=1920169 RepID=A0A3S0PYX3_9GAMM|nr:hypothetical protein [Dyella dinghuensis]RUL64279.1 hypothetical protein EKH79_09550 [Dyella dinghuensis]